MCQLLETLKLENGILHNLEYHNIRLNTARRELFGLTNELKLEKLIRIPEELNKRIFRCRVLYSKEIEKIEFIPFLPKSIKSLKVVNDDHIDYSYKYANREQLTQLLQKRNNCDEIIIIKKGLVTDCSIGNLVLWDGKKWITSSSPLLKGIRRMQLLNEKLISEAEIKADTILKYQKVGIINAFYGLDNMPEIPGEAIFP